MWCLRMKAFRPVIVVRSSVQKPANVRKTRQCAHRLPSDVGLFWHRVERLQQQPRSSRSGRIDGRPSPGGSNAPKRFGVAQPFWWVVEAVPATRRPHRRGGAETLKEPLITWDGCRVLYTRPHDDHWTKCLHPQTPYSSRFVLWLYRSMIWSLSIKSLRTLEPPHTHKFPRVNAQNSKLGPIQPWDVRDFFKAGPRASGSPLTDR